MRKTRVGRVEERKRAEESDKKKWVQLLFRPLLGKPLELKKEPPEPTLLSKRRPSKALKQEQSVFQNIKGITRIVNDC